MKAGQKTIRGVVTRVTFRNESSGYVVLRVEVDGEELTVVGNAAVVAEGEIILADGAFHDHPQYGHQFQTKLIRCELPSEANAMRKFLASGVISGIGKKTAERLVERFGDKALAVIAREPLCLTEFRGISQRKALAIGAQMRKYLGVHELMTFAADNGIATELAIQIWDLWHEEAMKMITQNPYCLCCDELEIAFAAVDGIGGRQGISRDAMERICAGLWYILALESKSGSVCILRERLRAKTVDMLEVDTADADTAIDVMCEQERFALYDGYEGEFVYLARHCRAEDFIAARMSLLLSQPELFSGGIEERIAALEEVSGITYDALQKKAIAQAVSNKAFILTGGPGTGKTTIIRAIIELLEQSGEVVGLAAPTGRAAKRMSELSGREAKTIHRLLEVRPGSNGRDFVHNERDPLDMDTVIVDEMSMVDCLLMESLLRGMRLASRLIMVGDSEQLPSVSAGNVLADLTGSGLVPMVHLNKVFRQAAQSRIVTNAHRIAQGDMPLSGEADEDCFVKNISGNASARAWLTDIVSRRLPQRYGFSPLRDIQVITPTRVGALGTGDLNSALQEVLNPPDKSKTEFETANRVFRVGDRVMQIRNNYDVTWTMQSTGEVGMGVFNGDIGNITMIDLGSGTIAVDFDGREVFYPFDNSEELEHAYAVTVHKAQGSEFTAVVLAVGGVPPRLLYRNLLYTAVTRARSFLLIAGSGEELVRMVNDDTHTERCTNLAERLQRACEI